MGAMRSARGGGVGVGLGVGSGDHSGGGSGVGSGMGRRRLDAVGEVRAEVEAHGGAWAGAGEGAGSRLGAACEPAAGSVGTGGGCGRGGAGGGDGVVGFVYDVGAARTRYTDEELREGLRRYGRRVGGRAFGVLEFQAWKGRPFGAGTVIRRFGTWHAALRSVGIEGASRRRVADAELLAEFERVWREMGRPPGERSLALRGAFSRNAYKARWGSVKRLAEMVGAMHRGEMTREQVLKFRDTRTVREGVRVDVRWSVLKRDRYRCVACGKSPATEAGVELEVDHIVPVARGGGNAVENLRTLCRACNRGKGVGG